MNDEAEATQTTDNVEPEQEVAQETAQKDEQTEQTDAQETETTTEVAEESEDKASDSDERDPAEVLAQYSAQQTPYQFKQEDGYVDPNEVAAAIEQRVNQQMNQRIQEQRAWEKIDKKYPDMDKDTREIILNQRIADAVQGRQTDLTKVADKIMGRVNSAKNEGRAEAKVSTKVQKAASLETATANKGEGNADDIRNKIAGGDSQATQDLLKDWIDKGLI